MDEEGCTYFICEEDFEKIKIGFATDIHGRLATLQTGNPKELILVDTIYGPKEIERMLHRAFKKYRVSREWFSFSDQIDDFISDVEELKRAKVASAHIKDPFPNELEIVNSFNNLTFSYDEIAKALQRHIKRMKELGDELHA